MALHAEQNLYIGLISGTSLDGIDAGLFRITDNSTEFLGALSREFPFEVRERLHDLTQPSYAEVDQMGELDIHLGHLFAEAANALIKKHGALEENIAAIGCHGQTIRHRPNTTYPFTLQIADPNTIAHHTGITTIADFRRRDMSAGGQGAPLAPAFHRAVFFDPDEQRCIVNIGGIANISAFANDPNHTLGYDSGPGNVLMDAWISKCLNKPFDEDGAWAANGRSQQALLETLLQHTYLKLPPPKSTGREDFHLGWLEEVLQTHKSVCAEDVQATLCEFSAETISIAVRNHDCQAVYLCGGGAKNTHLKNRIADKLPKHRIDTTNTLGIHPDWVETGIFAWLARQRVHNCRVPLSNITGAVCDSVLGAIYAA